MNEYLFTFTGRHQPVGRPLQQGHPAALAGTRQPQDGHLCRQRKVHLQVRVQR